MPRSPPSPQPGMSARRSGAAEAEAPRPGYGVLTKGLDLQGSQPSRVTLRARHLGMAVGLDSGAGLAWGWQGREGGRGARHRGSPMAPSAQMPRGSPPQTPRPGHRTYSRSRFPENDCAFSPARGVFHGT